MTPPPSSEAQLTFLSKLQRLFSEGDFTATYKFALLIALADLAVELGGDDGEPLKLHHRDIAAKFIELYWQQTAPYSMGRPDSVAGVLSQNNGAPAAVINAISEFRRVNPVGTAQSARLMHGYAELLKRVAQTVSAQPVNYLQNLGGQTDPFLFERHTGAVILNPGVAFCLRRFQPLVQQLSRSRWVAHIKRNTRNLPWLGVTDDLAAFLFETPRQALVVIGNGLRKLAGGHCFYCESHVAEADVDHFIPFSLYPRDLMHNFVLAHPSCNRSKSNTLAARPHLQRWLDQMTRHDDALHEIGEAAGLSAEIDASKSVARWGYSNAASSGGQAWIRPKMYESIDFEFGQAGLNADEADSGAVTLIQRFGSAANLMVQPQYPRYASH